MTNDVQFNEQDYGIRRDFGPKESWPTRLVIKLGLAKNKEQAPKVLLIIAVSALIVMFVVGFGGRNTVPSEDLPTPDELITP